MAEKTRTFINSIATACPPHDIQQLFLSFIPECLPKEHRAIFLRLMERSQIDHRYSCMNLTGPEPAFYRPQDQQFPATAARMELYKKHAPLLAHEAARQLVLDDEIRKQITHIVVGSCTGFYSPGVDCDLIASLELQPTVQRRLIGFMGCHAGLSVLATADEIVRADPKNVVLTVNIELSTLHFQRPQSVGEILGVAQFADGCAAAIVSARSGGLEILEFGSRIFREQAGAIRWDITDQGFAMFLDQRLPKILDEQVLSKMTNELTGDATLWAIHPGGRAILDVIQRRLAISDDGMRFSREILRKFGNMSSATILFVLKEMLDSGIRGNGSAMAFGPGLAVERMRFRKA
jgi:alpha-pyrone synthase